jgi:hypothetical protein
VEFVIFDDVPSMVVELWLGHMSERESGHQEKMTRQQKRIVVDSEPMDQT